MMNATDIIGFTADAAIWCEACAVRAYGAEILTGDVPDNEGNDVHPIFASDEDSALEHCGQCGAELVEHDCADHCDIWQLLERDAPDGCEDVQDLYSWSLNYDAGRGPFALFLDLIGWTEDELGEGQNVYAYESRSLGYVELGKLADALTAYADRPNDVREYVNVLMAAESR